MEGLGSTPIYAVFIDSVIALGAVLIFLLALVLLLILFLLVIIHGRSRQLFLSELLELLSGLLTVGIVNTLRRTHHGQLHVFVYLA